MLGTVQWTYTDSLRPQSYTHLNGSKFHQLNGTCSIRGSAASLLTEVMCCQHVQQDSQWQQLSATCVGFWKGLLLPALESWQRGQAWEEQG